MIPTPTVIQKNKLCIIRSGQNGPQALQGAMGTTRSSKFVVRSSKTWNFGTRTLVRLTFPPVSRGYPAKALENIEYFEYTAPRAGVMSA